MEPYDLLETVLKRNNLSHIPYNRRDVIRDFIEDQTKIIDYSLNIKIETREIDDETLSIKYTYIKDYNSGNELIIDMFFGLSYWNKRDWDLGFVVPNTYDKSYDEFLWQSDLFIYADKLLSLKGVGNACICYKICDIPPEMLTNIKLIYGDLSHLSEEDAKSIEEICTNTNNLISYTP